MRIVFIHHEFHDVSESSSFFIRTLVSLGHQVTVQNRTQQVAHKSELPDLFVLWQSERLLSNIVDLGKPVICIPMLDDALSLRVGDLASFKKVKFISFSKVLHQFLSLSGMNSSYIQYWPTPPNDIAPKVPRIFFWERTPSSFNVADLLNATKNSGLPVVLRRLPDPHDNEVELSQIADARLSFVDAKWMSKEVYRNTVFSNLVFVSPRLWEGIGLSFLEAMSEGCCVIAFNNPTMNEYISNRKNGILINKRTSRVDLSQMLEIGENARISALEGFKLFDSLLDQFTEVVIREAMSFQTTRRMKLLPGYLTLRKFIFLKTFLK